MNKKIEV
jgi:hypothetical protein